MTRASVRGVALALVGAAWALGCFSVSFCGAGRESSASLTARNGWRLDKMEVGPGGIGQLVVAEGFFIGEKDMYKVLNKQGRRYRMRPFAEERKAGATLPGIFQLGPFKIHLEQAFRGGSGSPDLERPEGYSGGGGLAGWGEDVPKRKDGYNR
mmetsp:Transcript_56483/g.105914  ORF Transcript_56483/g.105914 Transcript_56483/m.105914 type:complete len:153 (+) Transcript_56483:61-519(+)